MGQEKDDTHHRTPDSELSLNKSSAALVFPNKHVAGLLGV